MLTYLPTDQSFLPIGCSCVNQFQLEDLALTAPESFALSGSLFRWNLTTLAATAQIFNEVAADRAFSLLETPDDIVWDGAYPRSRKVAGFYFSHLTDEVGAKDSVEVRPALQNEEAFARLKDKYDRRLARLRTLPRQTTFVWSNIQPNLKFEIEPYGHVEWGDLILTADRMHAIKQSLRALGFDDPACVWICRPEDCAVDAPGPEVRRLSVPRSDDFRGAPRLFDEIFRGCLSR